MLKRLYLRFACFYQLNTSKMVPMPWPVTHILTAEIFYDRFFSHLDHREFIIGTCFPDIRYPARLPRKSTHFKHLTLSEIQSASAFQAGLLFHSYVDEIWNGFVLHQNSHIFTEVPHDKPIIHAMKALQDKFLYSKLSDWEKIAGYFEDVLPEEGNFNVPRSMLQRWHRILAYYFSKPPNINDLDMLKISLPLNLVAEIGEYYLAYQNNPTLIAVLNDFYAHAQELCQESRESIENIKDG